MSTVNCPARLLDPGLCLALRPKAGPTFFEIYGAAVKNTSTVEEVGLATDVGDLNQKTTDAEQDTRVVAMGQTSTKAVPALREVAR